MSYIQIPCHVGCENAITPHESSQLCSGISVSLHETFWVSRVSFTRDIWTQQYRQHPVITITAHWNIISHVINSKDLSGHPEKDRSCHHHHCSAMMMSPLSKSPILYYYYYLKFIERQYAVSVQRRYT